MHASAQPASRRLLTVLLLLPLLWWQGRAAAADLQPVPALRAAVTDQAQLLTPDQAQALDQKLQAFSRQKGSQVAVLIVPTTQPESIFDYSFRVADTWKLGRKGVDDGVLLVLAVQDRRSHLQVGYGLEGAIPDVRAKQILDDIMRPRFQQGDFAGGLNAGTDAVISLINGEALPAATPRGNDKQAGNGFVMALVAGFFAAMALRPALGRLPGGLLGGGLGFGVSLLLGTALAGALLVAVFVLLGTLFAGAGGLPMGGGRRGGFGGFGGGGFGGGGFGGGGFGGGGSSGSW